MSDSSPEYIDSEVFPLLVICGCVIAFLLFLVFLTALAPTTKISSPCSYHDGKLTYQIVCPSPVVRAP